MKANQNAHKVRYGEVFAKNIGDVSLRDIVQSATVAAQSDAATPCPYPRWSAASSNWTHVYSAALAARLVQEVAA